MEMQASRTLAVSQQQAWEALNDPEVLKLCIPGCDKFAPAGNNQYAVAMAVKIGPVSAKFAGKITLADIVPPESYTIAFDGSGGVAGFGKGTARVLLVPLPVDGAGQDSCELNYTVHASVGGKIAQLGQRLIEKGLLTEQQLQDAITSPERRRLGRELLVRGLIPLLVFSCAIPLGLFVPGKWAALVFALIFPLSMLARRRILARGE